MKYNFPIRPRRNRTSASIRNLVRENELKITDLIMPLFVIGGQKQKREISSMPGIYQYSLDLLLDECKALFAGGVQGVVLFPALDESLKDKTASESVNHNGLYLRTLKAVKEQVPGLTLITDIAMDPYSSDGHDGYVDQAGNILNDKTLPILAEMAVAQADMGVDIVAPSDMMDGRVAVIREALDQAGHTTVGIMSYSVKFASAYYGPFRDALDSTPKAGDKKTYQMDSGNSREGIREVLLDIEEGADIVMVKPGLPYLDIVKVVKDISDVPIAVYNVSGEYAMLKAASLNGWLDYKTVVMETLLSFKRAGADIILSYHTKDVMNWLNSAK